MASMRSDLPFKAWLIGRNRKRRMEASSTPPGPYTPPDVAGFDTTSVYPAGGTPDGYANSVLGKAYEITIVGDNIEAIKADIVMGLLRVVWTSSDTDVVTVNPKLNAIAVGSLDTVATGSSTISVSLQRTDTDAVIAESSSHMEVVDA